MPLLAETLAPPEERHFALGELGVEVPGLEPEIQVFARKRESLEGQPAFDARLAVMWHRQGNALRLLGAASPNPAQNDFAQGIVEDWRLPDQGKFQKERIERHERLGEPWHAFVNSPTRHMIMMLLQHFPIRERTMPFSNACTKEQLQQKLLEPQYWENLSAIYQLQELPGDENGRIAHYRGLLRDCANMPSTKARHVKQTKRRLLSLLQTWPKDDVLKVLEPLVESCRINQTELYLMPMAGRAIHDVQVFLWQKLAAIFPKDTRNNCHCEEEVTLNEQCTEARRRVLPNSLHIHYPAPHIAWTYGSQGRIFAPEHQDKESCSLGMDHTEAFGTVSYELHRCRTLGLTVLAASEPNLVAQWPKQLQLPKHEEVQFNAIAQSPVWLRLRPQQYTLSRARILERIEAQFA